MIGKTTAPWRAMAGMLCVAVLVLASLFRGFHITPNHLAIDPVILEIECAVLADHRIDGPGTGNHVTPAGGASGDGYHQQSRAL